ncbi:hypothetical protein RF55_15789 [Lasius niger]|uniref:Uncharacterized protein n=1 Tax=Lasius niger TaxID=67767 RepID=A0A0J7K5R6_LASNI|nr:hypothetical protein RF55_15789 [Lasius niger]
MEGIEGDSFEERCRLLKLMLERILGRKVKLRGVEERIGEGGKKKKVSGRERMDGDEGEDGRKGKRKEEAARNEKDKKRRKTERKEGGRRDEKYKDLKKK